MKKKPEGTRYRNLFERAGTIYYQRWVDGKRERVSCQTAQWSEAAAFRDEYEAQEGIGRRGALRVRREVPTFADFAARYLEEDVSHLATTTRKMRRSYLQADGPIRRAFGSKCLDEISLPMLREWWNGTVTARKLAPRTGRAYLDVLQAVFAYAIDLELIEESPVPRFRETIRRRSRTKAGRTERDPKQPIETGEEVARLVAAAEADGGQQAAAFEARAAEQERRERLDQAKPLRRAAGHARERASMHAAFVLTLLDAGLRVGEALALTWGQVAWGVDENDTTRSLYIDRNRPQGGAPEPPKSGRSRTVALSRRLRRALRSIYDARFRPGPEAAVFEGLDDRNFSNREWRRMCSAAGLGHRSLKDLRDTYASQLLTAGVPLAYISNQLGHADVGVTAKHYATWTGGSEYREPLRLEPGEVAADFLEKIAPRIAPSKKRPEARNPLTTGRY